MQDGSVSKTIWYRTEVGDNQEAKKEVKAFNTEDVFTTPKPERLIQRVLTLSTQEGDLVLDSFLGSGTTAAVAHKMGRKYIGIEMGEHAYTHCKVRLDKVVDGTDQGGISKSVEWKGGGGYKFYELAPSFVTIDEFGNPVIDNYYNDTKLIRAMCKLTNYTFAPSQKAYWKHGKGQGKNSIYVTTQMLSVAVVKQIANHLGVGETLLICPKKFEPGCEKVDTRITIKKIPQSILKACQFGKKEYLLLIKERMIEEIDEEEEIVYVLHALAASGRFTHRIPIYVDSPLAIDATEIFSKHPECWDTETYADFVGKGAEPFTLSGLTYVQDVEQSKRITASDEPAIIIAASGMCEAGRILHHLAHGVGNPHDTVLMVGFQAPNTLGRRLIEQSPQVRIYGDTYDRRCEVAVIDAFSGHAGGDELLTNIAGSNAQKILCVHGDEGIVDTFA